MKSKCYENLSRIIPRTHAEPAMFLRFAFFASNPEPCWGEFKGVSASVEIFYVFIFYIVKSKIRWNCTWII
jgi:hypothetical protein